MSRPSATANLEGGAAGGARSLNLGRPGGPGRGRGEMLAATPRAKGASAGPGPGRGKRGSTLLPRLSGPPTLSALGITKRESAEAQRLAALPEPDEPTLADLGDRPDGPCGPRGARVLAAVEGFLKGRKACRAPQCAPLVPREGRKGDLLSDTGRCSSPCGTRHAADAGGLGAAGAAPGIKVRVLSGDGYGCGGRLPPESNPPPGLAFTREVGQEKPRS
jgi:hypothetical protein